MSDYETSLKELQNETLVKLLYNLFTFHHSHQSSKLSIYNSFNNKSHCIHEVMAFSIPLVVIK